MVVVITRWTVRDTEPKLLATVSCVVSFFVYTYKYILVKYVVK